jgi:hypothetical protein
VFYLSVHTLSVTFNIQNAFIALKNICLHRVTISVKLCGDSELDQISRESLKQNKPVNMQFSDLKKKYLSINNFIFAYLKVVIYAVFRKLQPLFTLEIETARVGLHAVIARRGAGFIFHDVWRLVFVAVQNPAYEHRPGATSALVDPVQLATSSEAALESVLEALGREVSKVNAYAMIIC